MPTNTLCRFTDSRHAALTATNASDPPFIPVAQALTAQIFPPSELKRPLPSEEEPLLRRAEAWASGEELISPASQIQAPGLLVGAVQPVGLHPEEWQKRLE